MNPNHPCEICNKFHLDQQICEGDDGMREELKGYMEREGLFYRPDEEAFNLDAQEARIREEVLWERSRYLVERMRLRELWGTPQELVNRFLLGKSEGKYQIIIPQRIKQGQASEEEMQYYLQCMVDFYPDFDLDEAEEVLIEDVIVVD